MPALTRCRFTLVEMLIVITVVVILASLLAPALQKSLHRARGAACMGGPIKGIGAMINLYSGDFKGWVPPTCGTNDGRGKKWFMAFWDAGYLNTGLDMWCPSVPLDKKYLTLVGNSATDHTAFGSMATQIYCGTSNNSHQTDFYRFRDLKRPSKQMFAADSGINLNLSWTETIDKTPNCYYVIRPDKSSMGSWDKGRIDARHANCAALVNFAGNAELFMIHERSAPWLTLPFGQIKSTEYRIRCTNYDY